MSRRTSRRRSAMGPLSVESLEARRLLSAIVSGQTVTGAISTAGEVDTYTFDALAGDSVAVAFAEVGNTAFWPHVRLIAPDSSLVTQNWGSGGAGIDAVNLAQGGTYTIEMREFGDDAVGNYALTMARVPGPQLVDGEQGPLVSGQRRTGAIAGGDLDIYTFNASIGDSFAVAFAEVGNTAFWPHVQVYAPDGSLLVQNWASFGTSVNANTVAQGGTYYVVVREFGDDATGNYAMTYTRVPGAQPTDEDSGPLTSGQRRRGMIDAGDIDVYTFTANAGDSIAVAMADTTDSAFWPHVQVYAPDGSLLVQNWASFGTSVDHHNLPQSGTYYIIAREFGDDATGNYALSLARAPGAQPTDPDSGPLLSNQRRLGTIDPGDIDVFTFTASAGESFSIAMGDLANSSFWPEVQVFNPDGSLLEQNWSSLGTSIDRLNLVQSGTYYVVAREFGDDATGPYAITLAKFPGAQQPDTLDNDGGAIASGQTRSGAITPGDLDVYSLALGAAQSVTIRMDELGATGFTPRIDLFTPDGTRIDTANGGTSATIVLASAPASGTYHAVARESGDDAIANYSIAIDVTPGPDTRPPEVTRSVFDFNAPRQRIVLTLNESIAGSLDVADLTLRNLTDNTTVPSANLSATFNATANEITFEFPGYLYRALPDGDYRATLNAGSVQDLAGNPLGQEYSFDFFFLQGDANRDRRVNLQDFNILAINFGRAPRVFTEADFNYDGQVNLQDFNVLATAFGNVLATARRPGGAIDGGDEEDESAGALDV